MMPTPNAFIFDGYVVFNEHREAIVWPDDKVSDDKKGAINRAAFWQGQSWKQLYRKGWRCVRVEVRVAK